MNATKQFGSVAVSSPAVAALLYAGLLLALAAATVLSLKDVFEQRAAVASLGETVLRLERDSQGSTQPAAASGTTPGSPLLEGATETIAGAALLQRVIGSVTRHGGSILSSQLDLQGAQSKDGFLSVIANCDLEQPALQEIVYDLEAGMPFLFVDQLAVQAPTASRDESGGKLRVLISVSGKWQGAQ
jgi:general secretion pathway protein M